MSNFERDMANTMLDAADARIASLEADKADLLRVLGVADEKIRSGEDARGQYIRENAALEARCRDLTEEVRYLRTYGNKDCTAMADTARASSELETGAKQLGKVVPRCTGEHDMRKEEEGIFCHVCGIADYQLNRGTKP